MKGKLYGIGVGPGDPELLTLKALRILKSCDVIAAPGQRAEESAAYRIALSACPEIAEKEHEGIVMPMTRNPEITRKSHEEGALKLAQMLETGKNVAYLTLGDATIYSTYMYLHERILARGYEAEIVSGVPSFCAAAARLDTSLAENHDQIHVIPASYDLEEALIYPGTKVLMKSGRRILQVKESLIRSGAQVMVIENCGMEHEKVYLGAENIPEDAGYYTLIIVKDQ